MALRRMKDVYDLWVLSRDFWFDGASLSAAMAATFERRNTAVPEGVPTALTDEFAGDHGKQTQWAAFLKRHGLTNAPPRLSRVALDLRRILLEPWRAAVQRRPLSKSWKPGGPWA
jgi:hypothetical protein